MAIARYDPYTDSFIYEDSKTSKTATINLDAFPKSIIQMNVVEVSDNCINKIAEAVVRKLAEQTEPSDKCEQILDNIIAHKVEPIIKDGKVYLEQTEPNCQKCKWWNSEELKCSISSVSDCDFEQTEPSTDCGWK